MSGNGLRRRSGYGGDDRRSGYLFDDTATSAPVDAAAPYDAQLVALSSNRFGAGIDAIQGVTQKALGFEDAANANFREFSRQEELARRRGPEIQGLGEVFENPDTISASRLGQGLMSELAVLAPDIALTLGGAAVGTVAAPGAGTLGGATASTVARKAATELASKAAREAAEAEAERLIKKGVAENVARQSARLNAADVERRALRNALGATPEAQVAAARAQQIGSLVGATPAGMPGIAGDEETVQLAQEGTQGDAAVLLSGIVAGSMVDAIPALRAIGKIGDQVTGEVVKKTTDRFLTRALKEAGIQAGAEGSTEVVQQALTNASHAIVTENPELLYNGDAMKEYLLSFAVGGTLGGVLGGGIEVSGAAGRQAQRTASAVWEKTTKFFENRLRGPVQKDPGVAQNHAQADAKVYGAEGMEQGPDGTFYGPGPRPGSGQRTPQDPNLVNAVRERLSYGYDNARRSDEIKARAEEATRWFNNWKRDDGNRRFSLDGFSNAIVRASGGPEAAVNYRMLEFVDGIDPFVKQLRATGGDQAAADFLARSGSVLYRQFTAPQTLTEQDTALLGQLNQYISPQSRDVMSSLAAEWADRSVSLSSAYEREAADVTAGEVVAAEDAPVSATEQTQAEYEGDATEADLVFGAMQEDVQVDPVNRFVASGSAADQKNAIEFLEGPQSNNGKFRTNTFDVARNEAQFNKKRGTNGVLPYGDGKLWDATGHALRLLAQNRRDYASNDRIAPAKAALLDALSQAQAAGMPVDFGALKPGGYRIGGETVELTRAEIEAYASPSKKAPDRPKAELSLIRDVNNDLPPTFQGEEFEVDGPELGDADYRLGPRAAPPGAEARVVTPLDGKLRGAVRDAQGNIVEHGWEADEAAGGYRNTRDGTLVTSRAEAERRGMDSTGMVPDMAPVRGVTYRTPTEPQTASLSPEDAELKRIGAQVGADVMQGRPRILGVRSRYIEGAEPGTTRAVVAFYKDGKRTEESLDVFNDIVGYDYKNPNLVARGRAQQRAEERAQSDAVEVSYAPADRGELSLDPSLTSADATQLLARLNDPKFNSSLQDMPADDAREYAFLVEALADLAGPDSIYAQAANGALTPREVWQARPVTAQRGTQFVEADAEKLGRDAAARATEAELAVVKQRAADSKAGPYNVSRLNTAQAQAIQAYAAQFARKLGVPHVLSRFGGFLRRDGDVSTGATTISTNGKHFVAIHTANMRSPDPVLDAGKDPLARMRRTVAHELAHVLDRLHHAATGRKLTDDIEFRRDSLLWVEVQEAAAADPVMAKAFGYILRDTDPERAARELFAQLIATREMLADSQVRSLSQQIELGKQLARGDAAGESSDATTTESKFDVLFPYASDVIDARLFVARRAAAGRPQTSGSQAVEDAAGGPRGAQGADERNGAARTGDQPEAGAAGGRGSQRNAVLDPRTQRRSEEDRIAGQAQSLPALPASLAPVPKSTTAQEVRAAAAAESKAELERILSLPLEERRAALNAKSRRQSADPGAESVAAARDLIATAEEQALDAALAEAKRKFGPGASLTDQRVANDDALNEIYERVVAEYPGYAEAKATVDAHDAATKAANDAARDRAYAARREEEAKTRRRGEPPRQFRDDRKQYEKINDQVRRDAYAMTREQLLAAIKRAQYRYDKTPAADPRNAGPDPRSFIAMDLDAMRSIYAERFGASRASADVGAESVVSAPAGQHDLVAEGAYVQGIVRGMGLGPTNVTVTDNSGDFANLPSTAGEMRLNPDGSITIAMGKDLVGLERLEVLQHEIGHVALFKHIAKTAGVELKQLLDADGKMPTTNELISMLAETDPELHAALKADYDKWLAQNASKARGVNTMLGSRGGVARAAGRRARGGAGPRMQSMDQASVDTLMSMEEWIADGVIRALNRNTTATTITEKFFSDLAQALRAAYDTFRAAVDTFLGRQTSRDEAMPQAAVDAVKGTARGDNPLAPPSIQKWVDRMFTAEATRLGSTVSAGRREIILRAADFLHRVRKGFIADMETVAKAEAPKSQYAETLESTIKAWASVLNYALNTEQKATLNRILSRADVDEQIRSRLRNAPKGLLDPNIAETLDDVMVGPELRIAVAFAFQTAGNPDLKLSLGPMFGNAFGDAFANVTGWLGYASDADYATAIMKAVEDGTLAGLAKKNAADPGARESFDHVKAHTDALRAAGKAAQAKAVERNEKFSKTGFGKMLTNVRDYYGRIVSQSIFDRALESGSTNIRRIIAMLHKPGDVPGADAGLIRAVEHKIAVESQKAIRALDGLDEKQRAEVLRILQEATPGAQVATKATSPAVAAAVEKLKTQLAEFDVYARKAGMKYGYQRDFFPVVMDIGDKKAERELTALLMESNLEPGIRDFFNALARRKKADAIESGFEGAGNMPDEDQRPIEEMVKDMVKGAQREAEFSSSYDGAPRARGAQHRSMAFIYKDGTPEQIAKFAELQSKDMAGILGSYFEPMTRKAEYERRFGGGRLERMLQRAKLEGASADDIDMARAAVAASMGTYGKDAAGSPVLQHVSKDLARSLAGRKSQAAISGVMAYQNWRLLPLALLSSLTDPVLIAMRTGGDLGTAFAGIRDGLRANFTKAGREEMARMIDQIGAAADFGAEANLVYALGGLDQAPLARQSNDLLFRWNGMTWLAKATRHMALHSAHGFLAKHALRPGKHSARYMRELGLRDGDIQVETVIGAHGRPVERVKTTTGDTERDARVRDALVRFVDDAVLRPNPIQSPLWHADPYMGVVTQYKGFLYAMWDQMGRRIQAEVGNGNFVGPVVAAIMYTPLAIMAMLMRETIQYGEEGNPARAGWDVVDYTGAALNNSGMLGPSASFFSAFENDLSTDRLPVLSQLGPTFGQATNVASSAVGTRSGSETFQEAIPTQVIWEKWFGTEANRQPTEQMDPELTEPEMGLRE